MTQINTTLQRWFTQRLITEQHVSPHTITAYRDSIRLLLGYLNDHHHRCPSDADFVDLDATVIGAFLTWLETDRNASISTRNARLAAIRSFFTYASFHHPEHAQLIARVLSIPTKRGPVPLVTYLTPDEIDALTTAPNPNTRTGRRDRCLLTVAIQTGLRVTELVELQRDALTLGAGGYLQCVGKGRKHRAVPLTAHTQRLLTSWLAEHPATTVFPRPDGQPLTRDAVRRIIQRHTTTAASRCPTLRPKNITPHVLRHTCAMQLLRANVDIAVIALILGHADIETTSVYLHADHDIKQRALDRLTPPDVQPGRYQPPDNLLAFLNAL
jgi:integrase/recombinase XerD